MEFAPRISPRLRAEIERLAETSLPAADITRAVGARAEDLRLRRPSYEQIRKLVVEHRNRPRYPSTTEVLLDVAFRVRAPGSCARSARRPQPSEGAQVTVCYLDRAASSSPLASIAGRAGVLLGSTRETRNSRTSEEDGRGAVVDAVQHGGRGQAVERVRRNEREGENPVTSAPARRSSAASSPRNGANQAAYQGRRYGIDSARRSTARPHDSSGARARRRHAATAKRTRNAISTAAAA